MLSDFKIKKQGNHVYRSIKLISDQDTLMMSQTIRRLFQKE